MKSYQFTEIDRATSALWNLDAGCSANGHFKIAAAAFDAGISFEEFNRWSATGHNYKNEADCLSTWRSASKPGPIRRATLFHLSHAAGGHYGARPRAELSQSPQAERKPPVQSSTGIYALTLWNLADRDDSFVAEHAYAVRKEIAHAFGAARGLASGSIVGQKVDCLIIPIRKHGTGEVVAVQAINADGKKQTFGALGDDFLLLGDERNKAAPWLVVEGWATSHSARQTVRESVVVISFGAGRMDKVADLVAEFHKPDRLVIFEEPEQ